MSSLNSELRILRDVKAVVSEDSVLSDIADPFSFPVRYTHTFVRSPDKELQPAPLPVVPQADGYTFSTQFACLPTAFSISPLDEPLTAHALSYINNIHPSHGSLYNHIETVLARSVPLFEHVLTDLHRDNPLYQRIKGSCKYTEWDEPEEPEHSDDEEGWATYEREMRIWALQRPISVPDIPEAGYQGGLEERRTTISLRGKTVHALLRITDINLVRCILRAYLLLTRPYRRPPDQPMPDPLGTLLE